MYATVKLIFVSEYIMGRLLLAKAFLLQNQSNFIMDFSLLVFLIGGGGGGEGKEPIKRYCTTKAIKRNGTELPNYELDFIVQLGRCYQMNMCRPIAFVDSISL